MDVGWRKRTAGNMPLVALVLLVSTAATPSYASSMQTLEEGDEGRGTRVQVEALTGALTRCFEDVGSCLESRALPLLDSLEDMDEREVVPGVTLEKVEVAEEEKERVEDVATGRSSPGDVLTRIAGRVQRFLKTHKVKVEVPKFLESIAKDAKDVGFATDRTFRFGRNSFLTGFGLGFLAFGLKKLLLPFFIGAQIVKSVLLAMFLPSILGGVGKLLGKGVSSLGAASAGASSHGGSIDDFDFKDNHPYDDHGSSLSPYSAASSTTSSTSSLQSAASSNVAAVTYPQNRVETIFGMQDPYYVGGANGGTMLQRIPTYTASGGGLYLAAPSAQGNRYSSILGGNKYKVGAVTSSGASAYGNKFNYVTKNGKNDDRLNTVSDFKVFHNIPSSALLLTTYDPFYSPLLSRVDSVFKQLGRQTEGCRERLVCDMYRNPAKFAPFSNLISAQLSRELNELKKPQVDNPEILRFFRYMKAAKVGQDNREECPQVYSSCDPSTLGDGTRGGASAQPPMVTTYNDINRLVQARNLASTWLGPEGAEWAEATVKSLMEGMARWLGA